jgi:hypothetical protein
MSLIPEESSLAERSYKVMKTCIERSRGMSELRGWRR